MSSNFKWLMSTSWFRILFFPIVVSFCFNGNLFTLDNSIFLISCLLPKTKVSFFHYSHFIRHFASRWLVSWKEITKSHNFKTSRRSKVETDDCTSQNPVKTNAIFGARLSYVLRPMTCFRQFQSIRLKGALPTLYLPICKNYLACVWKYK